MDFLELVGEDASAKVLMGLDDPSDLARASSVSKSWYRFVIRNGLFKKLCKEMCPEVSIFPLVIEESSSARTAEGESSRDTVWEMLERDHKVYSYLSRCLVSPAGKEDCILEPIGASSTDSYPDESINNTLEPSDRARTRPSYWSSKGEDDPRVPENLTYRLKSNACIVSEIKMQPFKAFFQFDHPIYSAKAVRFRIGYTKIAKETTDKVLMGSQHTDDNYIWTYVSPEFPMAQENTLQSFKLPRPVIGGIVQIELLGRVQKQQIGGLFYFCVCYVKVIGRNLSPVFHFDKLHGTFSSSVLKYFPDARVHTTCEIQQSGERMQSTWQAFTTRFRELIWNRITLNRLLVAMQNDDFSPDEDLL